MKIKLSLKDYYIVLFVKVMRIINFSSVCWTRLYARLVDPLNYTVTIFLYKFSLVSNQVTQSREIKEKYTFELIKDNKGCC